MNEIDPKMQRLKDLGPNIMAMFATEYDHSGPKWAIVGPRVWAYCTAIPYWRKRNGLRARAHRLGPKKPWYAGLNP